MKFLKVMVLLFAASAAHAAWFGGSGGADYSNNAQSMFICASTAAATTQAGLSATSPAISLYNPISSSKNLVLEDVGVTFNSSPAAAAGVMIAYSTATITPTTTTVASNNGIVTPALIGTSTTTATGICLMNVNAPATPKAIRYLGGTTGAAAIGNAYFDDPTQGKIVVPPGFMITLQTTSAASVLAHFEWMEQPR